MFEQPNPSTRAALDAEAPRPSSAHAGLGIAGAVTEDGRGTVLSGSGTFKTRKRRSQGDGGEDDGYVEGNTTVVSGMQLTCSQLSHHSRRASVSLPVDQDQGIAEAAATASSPHSRPNSSGGPATSSTLAPPPINTSNKRARTGNNALDSLADAASQAISSSGSFSTSTGRVSPSASSPLVMGFQPADLQQQEQVKATLLLRQQQMQEIERRKPASASQGGSGIAGLNQALGKLKNEREKSSEEAASGVSSAGGSGLAKRRGDVAREKVKNLTVVTGHGGEASQGALKTAPANVATMPSVLMGVSSASGGQHRDGGRGPQTAHPQQQSYHNSRPPATAYPTFREPGPPRDLPPSQVRRRPSESGPSSAYPPPSASAHGTLPNGTYKMHQLHPAPSGSSSAAPRDQYVTYTSSNPPPRRSPPSAHPSHYPGGPLSPLPRVTATSPVPPSAPGSASSSKQAFLSLFSTFYDSLSDSRVLSRTLDDQLRRSSALLHTLSDSGKVFEELLETRIRSVRQEHSREMGRVEARLDGLEKRLGLGASRPPTGLGIEHGPLPTDTPVVESTDDRADLLERIARLERALELKDGADDETSSTTTGDDSRRGSGSTAETSMGGGGERLDRDEEMRDATKQ